MTNLSDLTEEERIALARELRAKGIKVTRNNLDEVIAELEEEITAITYPEERALKVSADAMLLSRQAHVKKMTRLLAVRGLLTLTADESNVEDSVYKTLVLHEVDEINAYFDFWNPRLDTATSGEVTLEPIRLTAGMLFSLVKEIADDTT